MRRNHCSRSRVVTGGAAAPARAVDHLLVGEHGLVGRAPVDRRPPAIGDALLEHAQEQPLVPAVVVGQAGGDLAVPRVADAEALQLPLHVRDVGERPRLGVELVLDRGVLGRQAERVPAERVQHVEALHPLQAGDDVADHVVADVADVGVSRGIREHLEAVELRPRPIDLDLEGAGSGPARLPFLLDGLGRVIGQGSVGPVSATASVAVTANYIGSGQNGRWTASAASAASRPRMPGPLARGGASIGAGARRRRRGGQHLDRRVQARAQRRQVVAALGDDHEASARRGVGGGAQRRQHRAVAVGRDLHLRQRILDVRVVAHRQDREVRGEGRQDRHDHPRQHVGVVVVAGAGLDGHVDGASPAGAEADLGHRAGARVARVLVGRDVEDGLVVLEDLLGAVAVVDVDVDHGDARRALRAGVGGGHRDVVEQAEPHRPLALGVMPRRPHEHQRRSAARHRVVDADQRRPGRQASQLVGLRRGERVGIEHRGAARGSRDALDVVAIVDRPQLLERRRPRRQDRPALPAPGGRHRVEDVGPFRPLWMPRGSEMIGELVRGHDGQRHARHCTVWDRALTRGRGPAWAFGCYSRRWARRGASRRPAGIRGTSRPPRASGGSMTAHPPAGSTLRKPLRLWPGVALGVLILVLRYVTPQIAPRLFEADMALNVALFSFLGALLASILVLLWWLLFSRAPWVERLLALGLVAVGFLAGPLVQDISITAGAMGMLYPILVIPIVALAFVAWAALTRHLSDGVRRATMAAAILLAFASLGLIRTGGFTAGMKHDFAWRWTPTPEERLLAAEATLPPPAPAPAPAPPASAPVATPASAPAAVPASTTTAAPPTARRQHRPRRRRRRPSPQPPARRPRRRPRRRSWPSGRASAGRAATGSCTAPASRPTGARRPRSRCGAAPSGRAGRRSPSPAIASTRRSSAARTRWSRATTRRPARRCGTIATAPASGNRTGARGRAARRR